MSKNCSAAFQIRVIQCRRRTELPTPVPGCYQNRDAPFGRWRARLGLGCEAATQWRGGVGRLRP
jgi:hypothetical protein